MKLKILTALTLLTMSTSQVLAAQLVTPTGKDGSNPASVTNPLDIQQDVGNATVSATNPVPSQLSLGNAAVATSNSLPVQLTNNTAVLNGIVSTTANCIPVAQGNSNIATFAASTGFGNTLVATATDVVGIVGSATKTVKIQKIIINNYQTTGGFNQWFVIKRSVADTGSTPVAATDVPLDSTNAAGTAVVQFYTSANPTRGTAVGTIASSLVYSPILATGVGTGTTVLFDAKVTGQPIVLRGIAQECDVNYNGAALATGLVCSVDVFWTEE